MLGRTNVMQRKEPTITGEVKNFVVASGNTIEKGDFVSYFMQTGKKTVTDYGFGESQKVYDKANDLYVALYSKNNNANYYVCLVDVSTGLEIKQAFMFTSKPVYEVDNNGNLFIGVGTTFYAYKYQNSQFVLIGTVTTAKNIMAITKANESNNYVVIVEEWNGNSYHSLNLYGQKITVSSNSVSLGTESLIKQYVGFYTEPTTIECGYMGDNQFIFVWEYPYVSSNAGYAYYMICSYQNSSFTAGDIKYTESLSSSSRHLLTVGFLNGAVYIKTTNNNKVYKINSGTLVSVGTVDSQGVVANDEYIVSIYTNNNVDSYYLYKWDKTSGNLTRGSYFTSTIALSILGTSIFFIKGLNQIIQTSFSEAKTLTFDTENLNLSDGYFDNTVQAYSGNFTVGFAKTGGTAGQTIQVYVPQSS